MDFEGRNLRLDFDSLSVMSLYLPSGTNIDRLEHKFMYMDDFQNYINALTIEPEPTNKGPNLNPKPACKPEYSK